jgi:hypothetical protein
MMTVDDMQAHIDRFIAELRATRFPLEDDFHVHWIENAEAALAITDGTVPVEVHLPKVRSVEDYITCLHELGHVSGRYQRSRHSMTRERWAWQYAREQALDWAEEMENLARECLRGALANADGGA